ncbi:MAG: bifunctional lysylphosphatidylglycerol flippase/synthetase MprF [Myxococcota bacterium]
MAESSRPADAGETPGARRTASLTKQRLVAIGGPLISVVLFAVAASVLHEALAGYRHGDLVDSLRAIPPSSFLLAALFTAGSYLSLTGYDALALHWARARLDYRRIALASFIAYVFSHNVGLSFFGGTAVRLRMFTSWGIPAARIARMLPFNAVTYWLGFLLIGGVASIAAPLAIPGDWNASAATSRPFGVVLLAALALYVLQSARHVRSLRLFGHVLELPGLGLTAAQIAVASVDWLFAASVFIALLPPAKGLEPQTVLSAFLLAQVLGVASQVPGGVGVFESLMVVLLGPWLPASAVLGTAVAYRLVYYLLPLLLGIALFASFELGRRRRLLDPLRRLLGQWAPDVIPHVFTVGIFAAGVVLLLSGSTPAASGRIEWLAGFLPLAVLETSHLLASVVGVALLFLARALERRVDAAWAATLALLAIGAVLSLLKGLDWEEAALLTLLALLLLPCRRHFHRRSPILSEAFTPGWIVSFLLVFVGTVFVVGLSYRHVEYRSELWWQFAFDAHAPRTLRALLASAVGAALFGLARLLRPARPPRAPATPAELERAVPLVLRADRAGAHLALLGDKRLLFAEGDAGFLMYGIAGRCWVAMGDPIGPAEARRELAWRFHELVDAHGGMTAFYEVEPENLPLYLDLGLTLHKLGEDARVPLEDFSLEGSHRRELRSVRRRMEREGACFELVPREGVPSVIDEVARVSDAWLAKKKTREKRFSLGRFEPDYLARTPLAVVRREGRMVAFANVWAPETRNELSIDLMRYDAEAPSGVMDFLFAELMLWGREQGYAWFGLGMAPLAGLEHHRLAPAWNRLGALLFRHGENFYNFRGLRAYKAKFDPVWEPRYLASPGRFSLPIVLTQTATLISGGVIGAVHR